MLTLKICSLNFFKLNMKLNRESKKLEVRKISKFILQQKKKQCYNMSLIFWYKKVFVVKKIVEKVRKKTLKKKSISRILSVVKNKHNK